MFSVLSGWRQRLLLPVRECNQISTERLFDQMLRQAQLHAFNGKVVGVLKQGFVSLHAEIADERRACPRAGYEAVSGDEIDRELLTGNTARAQNDVADSPKLVLEIRRHVSLHGHKLCKFSQGHLHSRPMRTEREPRLIRFPRS